MGIHIFTLLAYIYIYIYIYIYMYMHRYVYIMCHCIKRVRIWGYFSPHFPTFGLNAERYGVSLHIQFECGKMQIRITPNMDTFHAVYVYKKYMFI